MSEQAPKRGRAREPIVLLEPEFLGMTPDERDRAVKALASLLAVSRRRDTDPDPDETQER